MYVIDMKKYIIPLPFFETIINLSGAFNINIEFNTKIYSFKKRKKDIEYLDNIDISSRPNHYDTTNVEIDEVISIFNNIQTNNNINEEKIFMNKYRNKYCNYYVKIIKNVNLENDITDEKLRQFKKVYIYYKILFIKLYKHMELIDKLKINKNTMLRLDEHGKSHNNKMMNTLKPNTSHYITVQTDNRHINDILFKQYYKNITILYDTVTLIYSFLLDCLNNKTIPKFIYNEYDSYTYDIRDIYNEQDNKFTIYMLNIDMHSCFNDKDAKLTHPMRLSLCYNKAMEKYRLQYDDKFLLNDDNIKKYKFSLKNKTFVDVKHFNLQKNNMQ